MELPATWCVNDAGLEWLFPYGSRGLAVSGLATTDLLASPLFLVDFSVLCGVIGTRVVFCGPDCATRGALEMAWADGWYFYRFDPWYVVAAVYRTAVRRDARHERPLYCVI